MTRGFRLAFAPRAQKAQMLLERRRIAAPEQVFSQNVTLAGLRKKSVKY
jgi:hypothetical protein